MAAQLLSDKDLYSPQFLSFLVRRNPELRTPIEQWLKRAKEPGATRQQIVQALLSVGPAHVLQAAQEEYLSKVWWSHAHLMRAATNNSPEISTLTPQVLRGW